MLTDMTSITPDDPIRWGVIATGGIAEQAVRDIALLDDAQVVAVASRSAERAAAFAADHAIARSYGSYDELIADPDVDAIYIATPHAQHHMIATRAIAAASRPRRRHRDAERLSTARRAQASGAS